VPASPCSSCRRPDAWTVPSRFVALTRTDKQGRFIIEGLPPSEYWPPPRRTSTRRLSSTPTFCSGFGAGDACHAGRGGCGVRSSLAGWRR
jgi:hypothetical protein